MGSSFSLIKNIQVKAFVKPALVTMIDGQERLFEFPRQIGLAAALQNEEVGVKNVHLSLFVLNADGMSIRLGSSNG